MNKIGGLIPPLARLVRHKNLEQNWQELNLPESARNPSTTRRHPITEEADLHSLIDKTFILLGIDFLNTEELLQRCRGRAIRRAAVTLHSSGCALHLLWRPLSSQGAQFEAQSTDEKKVAYFLTCALLKPNSHRFICAVLTHRKHFW